MRPAPGGLEVTVEVPLSQLGEASVGSTTPADEAAWERERLQLEAHVRAVTPAGECRVESRRPHVATAAGDPRLVFELDFGCPDGPVTLGSDYGLERDPTAEMVCSIEGRAHVFRQGALDLELGTPPTLLQALVTFVELGAEHVASGIDHVLFIFSLLLGVAGETGTTRRRGLSRLVKLVTGFTLGHSVTLILAALDVVRLPSRLTESAIALSIVVVAVQNMLSRKPAGRALMCTLFGLVHGFGFASALSDIGLPRKSTLPVLLAFNLGIELAQLTIVLSVYPLLAWAARHGWFRSRVALPASMVIAVLGAAWLGERALGLSLLPAVGN